MKLIMSAKEVGLLVLLSAIVALGGLFFNFTTFINYLVLYLIIFFVYVVTQKLTAYYHEAVTETKVWNIQRHGFPEKAYSKSPIPIGLIIAVILPLLTMGRGKWLALTQTEIVARKARVARRHGFYSFPELTEWHIGSIAASGIIALFGLSVLSYIFGFTLISKLSVYFAFYNLIPYGNLDGSKVFFGSPGLWAVLFVIALVGVGFGLFLP